MDEFRFCRFAEFGHEFPLRPGHPAQVHQTDPFRRVPRAQQVLRLSCLRLRRRIRILIRKVRFFALRNQFEQQRSGDSESHRQTERDGGGATSVQSAAGTRYSIDV